jgi:2-polyprenyl-6-methoxyphenol hydroxylase-like FAD-dependent oxidoreductase
VKAATGKPARIPKALIIGGSMAGLFAGLLMRRAGWDVEIFERNKSQLYGRGAGIVTHDELFDVLKRTGIDSGKAKIGVSVVGLRVFARDGRIVEGMVLDQVLTSWGHLYNLLRKALPPECYRQGRVFLRAEETETAVIAHFEDGFTASGDLLVGADGIFSTIRAGKLPEVKPLYAGYIAWRGLAEEADLTASAREGLFDYFAFSLPPGEQMLGYPVAGENEAMERGRRRFNFVWYRPAGAEGMLSDLLTDAQGVTYQLSIPPNKVRPDVIAAMRADAARLLAPQFAEVVAKTAQPFIQAIYDLESPRLLLGRRIVILGDAAFVARPHVGMGVTKAAGDALSLAEAVAAHPGDLPAALAAFEAERLRVGAAVVRRARHLGAYMQAQILTAGERAMAERHRSANAVMAETATATGMAVW